MVNVALIVFDTYGFIENLKGAGFAEEQAKALADGLRQVDLQHVATKNDVALLREDVAGLRSEIALVRQEMLQVKAGLLQWFTGMLIGQAALVAALVKLLNP